MKPAYPIRNPMVQLKIKIKVFGSREQKYYRFANLAQNPRGPIRIPSRGLWVLRSKNIEEKNTLFKS